jgi:hypothetical protein
MNRARFAQFIFVVSLASLLSLPWPRHALAAPPPPATDAQVQAEYEKIVSGDIAEANFGSARRRLTALVERCRKKSVNCSSKTSATVQTMLGVVLAQMGQREAALQSFAAAFEADSATQIPSNADVTEATKRLFAEARAEYEASHARPDDPFKVVWKKREAGLLFAEGLAAKKRGDNAVCIEKIRAALDLEENAGARVHLSDCLDGSGKLVDSAREVTTAIERATLARDEVLVAAARQRAESLVKRLGHLKFEIPTGMPDLRVTFDERNIPKERLNTTFVVDPGEHRIRAEGAIGGNVVIDTQTVNVGEGKTVLVKLSPKPRAVTQGQLECLLSAKTESEIQVCFQKQGPSLVVKAATEFSAYTDTQRVNVVTPAIYGSVYSPTAEWSANGSYLVDVVTAASADVVSTASPAFRDVRHAGSLGGSYRGFKPWSFSANGNLSIERDYTSRGVEGRVGVDTLDKQFTPSVGYGFSYDTIGRAGVPFDVFSNNLTTHAISATGTIVLSPKSLLVVGGSIQVERGDQSKPYRYIPMFNPGTNVPNHSSIEYVNAVRLPERPLEQLPLERDRFALAGRYVSRIQANATLRIEERLYADSWGTKGSTTDARYIMDLTPRLTVWTALRLHFQSGASFYERAYFATGTQNGTVLLPIVRTTDRELGPLLTPSPGVGTRIVLTGASSTVQLGLSFQGTLMFTKYFDAIYTGSRTAVYGTTGLDVEFQ